MPVSCPASRTRCMSSPARRPMSGPGSNVPYMQRAQAVVPDHRRAAHLAQEARAKDALDGATGMVRAEGKQERRPARRAGAAASTRAGTPSRVPRSVSTSIFEAHGASHSARVGGRAGHATVAGYARGSGPPRGTGASIDELPASRPDRDRPRRSGRNASAMRPRAPSRGPRACCRSWARGSARPVSATVVGVRGGLDDLTLAALSRYSGYSRWTISSMHLRELAHRPSCSRDCRCCRSCRSRHPFRSR